MFMIRVCVNRFNHHLYPKVFSLWIVLNQIEEALVQVHDPDLRKVLNPTTADLRFADFLVKHVTENRDDVFLDGTGWEGGDEWIRAQFGSYLHALLAATIQPGKFWNILICKCKQSYKIFCNCLGESRKGGLKKSRE